jgi:DNA-binding NtrC family response regulator
MSNEEIIIVEDNETMRLGMTESLRREGHQVHAFADAPAALQYLRKNPAALVVTDLRMAPMDGLQLLEQVKINQPETEVLMVSAYGTVQDAVKAMQLGALDFLTKPFSNDELRIRVRKALEKVRNQREITLLRARNAYLQDELATEYESIVGNSPVMREIFQMIDRVAQENSAVLIEGDSGTGKELVARAIHKKSPRNLQPFIRVNCGALNDNLLESELFGHEKGAFTGAIRQKKGRFELADGGTLFLDEIGDVSQAMQVKLLRVLQERELERVGGEKTIRVDVRIIAATNKDLQKLMLENAFREDLFYRLSVIPIRLPALRQRREDIPLLARHFLDRLNRKRGRNCILPDESLQLLREYNWPGNIRELENLVERLSVISSSDSIEPELVVRFLSSADYSGNSLDNLPLEEALFAFEKRLIANAMKKCGGVKNRAAKMLGIVPSVLYYKLEKFGMLK